MPLVALPNSSVITIRDSLGTVRLELVKLGALDEPTAVDVAEAVHGAVHGFASTEPVSGSGAVHSPSDDPHEDGVS